MHLKVRLSGYFCLATILAGVLILLGGLPAQAAPNAAISLSSSYQQNFDALGTSNSAWVDDSTISGWYATQSNYSVSTGTATAGGMYSFGSSGSSDRALGSIASNSVTSIIYGIRFINDTGTTITSLTVGYTGEQWRNGDNTNIQQLDFSYQVGSSLTSLTTGNWVDANELDFASPIHTTSASALDGNAAANRTALSTTIAVNIPVGQEIMLRWLDSNDSGADHGLSIDDLSVTAQSTPGDSAPAVSGTTPSANASGVATSANLTINFSEAVNVNDSWFSISCTSSGAHAAVVSDGPQSFTLNPDVDFTAGENCTVTIWAAQVSDQDSDDPPDIMTSDYTWNFTAASASGFTAIHTIQGSGASSPLVGQVVSLEAIVVGDFQDTISGFFVQEEDADADANPATSEGLFVYSNSQVNAGDQVQVTGTVVEYYDETEISSVSNVIVVSSGNPLPGVASVSLPVSAVNDWERYEGMRVSFAQTLTVAETYLLGRGGMLTLADQRIYQPTHLALPGAPALAVAAENALHSIILDDGSQAQNPASIPWPAPIGLSAANTVRNGDSVSGVTGILTYRYHGWSGSANAYRIYPTANPVFESANPRPSTPAASGTLRVASFNVLNYFNGPSFPTARGANTDEEFTRQRNKIIAAILGLDADVIGLMEIENDGYGTGSAIQDLVNGLNAVAGGGTYAFVNPGSAALGGDEIAVGLIYRPGRVSLVGSAATTTAGAFTQGADRRNRQPLAQTFAEISSGETFTVVVNHFKSKGSDCNTANSTFPADPDTGDGQGNCNLTRTMAAADLLSWLASDPTGSSDPDVIIMGDLNSYALEDPITSLKNSDFTDLINAYQGSAGYSYVFDGQLGYLDYGLASANMLGQITQVNAWHINADEPISLDYNTEFKTAAQILSLYAPDAYRASDHDPVVIDLFLPYGQADLSDLDSGYAVAAHQAPHNIWLGASVDNDLSFENGVDNASDNGVTIASGNWSPGQTVTINVEVTGGPGWLSGWFDWNLDGDFADAGEKAVNQAVAAGLNPISFSVPGDALIGVGGEENTAMPVRFRLYESLDEPAMLQPLAAVSNGIVVGGEVEDYTWGFTPTAIRLKNIEARNHLAIWIWGLIMASGLGGFLLGGWNYFQKKNTSTKHS